MKADCPVLLRNAQQQQQVPELIGSMEIGYRGLQACQCAGGRGDTEEETAIPASKIGEGGREQ